MTRSVRCRVGDVVRCGRALVVRAPVESGVLARAVRTRTDSDARVAITAESPGQTHKYVGHIHPEMGLRTRTALAAAGRSRGLETPHDEALSEARARLAALDTGEGTARERARLRQAAATAASETERLREEAAAARGRLQARREQGLDPTPAAEELAETIERLSEAQTDAAAARQRLETARERTRKRREAHEKQRRVEERVANLRRRARAHLREQVKSQYRTAVDAVPGTESIADPYEADPVSRALAVARVADITAPVVLDCERFESAVAAADWLDAPVIQPSGPGEGRPSRQPEV